MDRLMRISIVLALTFVFLHSVHDVEARKRIQKIRSNDDNYDCVDFYKQPAFDHPLLANHTFHHEMRPSSMPMMMTSAETNVSVNQMEIQFKGCPVGTVPIRRLTAKDRIKEKYLVNFGSKYNVLDAVNPGAHYAIARTKLSPTKKYNGGSAGLSLWNPVCQNPQYSSGRIVIRNGNDNIRVGWTVNPALYDDDRTHLFIFTATDKVQCFNTYCPGFVVTNKDIPVDIYFDLVSKRGGQTYYILVTISKDVKDGNWWLRYGKDSTPIGFWPRNIFTSLADTATRVEWGGQVHSPPNVPSPPMGGGDFLKDDTSFDAYAKLVSVINENHDVVDATDIETISDTSSYQVKYVGNVGGEFGNLVEYGGPGGVTGM